MAAALELEGVSKRFGSKLAVRDLTLRIEPGTFLGLVGRNGAGKSTTLKMLTGILRPSSGRIRVLGRDLAAEPIAIKREIGVMPEDMALLDRLSAGQYLRFVGRMYGLADALIDARRDELFDKLELDPEPGQMLADFSFGMKKKVALAAALLHGPRLVFLDEPFEGVDPIASRTIKDILASLTASGVTLVLTSHVLEIVERLCPQLAILDEGTLMGSGTLAELRARHGGESLESLFLALHGGARDGSLSWL